MPVRPWKKRRVGVDQCDDEDRARDLVARRSTWMCRRFLTERRWPQRDCEVGPTSMRYTTCFVPITDSLGSCIRFAEVDAGSLRQEVERLNAVASCEGFDPVENPEFWRQNLQIEGSHALSPVTRATLARYQLFCAFDANDCDPPRLATVLAACVAMPQAKRARTDAIQSVQAQLHLRSIPLPLQIELYTEPTLLDGMRECEPFQWNMFRRTLFHLNCIVAQQLHPQRVAIAVGSDDSQIRVHRVDHDGLVNLYDVVCLPFIMLTELHCRVDNDPKSVQVPLSDLMRELARVDTLRAMAWQFRHADQTCFAAIGSAVSRMLRLQYVALSVDDLGDVASTYRHSCRVAAYYQWMLFALAARQIRRASPLSVRLEFHEPAARLFQQAMDASNYLAALIPDTVLSEYAPVYLPHGTTASVLSKAVLNTVEGSLCAPLLHQTRHDVDVICQYGSHAIVVYPGVGLLTTSIQSLTDMKGIALSSPSRQPPRLAEVVSHGSNPKHLIPVLRLLGRSPTALDLQRSPTLDTASLRALIESCPRLTKLSLGVCHVESFVPLIEAYEMTPPCQISTLFVDGASIQPAVLQELLETLAQPQGRMASVLRRLCLLPMRGLAEMHVKTLARVLAVSRRLEYLRCGMDFQGESTRDWGRELLSPYVDQPISQSPRSKTAAYTFLLVCQSRRTLWRFLAHPCRQLVVQFAAIPARRYVHWTHI